MQFNEYQKKALSTASIGTRKDQLLAAAMGMCGEAGEFIDVIKKLNFHNHSHTIDVDEKLKNELGDILWYVSLAADALGSSLDYIAQSNLCKLEKRYPDGFSSKTSEERYEVHHGVIANDPNPTGKVPKLLCPDCDEYHSMVRTTVRQNGEQRERDKPELIVAYVPRKLP